MKKKVLLSLLLIVVLSTTISTSFAYARLGTGKVKGGAKGIKFWIASEANEYKDSIKNGITKWNGISSNVSVSRTTTKSHSRCDNYWGQYFGPDEGSIIAETFFYLNNTLTTNYNIDWYWCKIKYNSDWFNYDELNYTQRKAIAAHEYGHFLGLAHVDSVNKLMYPYGDECTATGPTQDEKNGIIAIYGS